MIDCLAGGGRPVPGGRGSGRESREIHSTQFVVREAQLSSLNQVVLEAGSEIQNAGWGEPIIANSRVVGLVRPRHVTLSGDGEPTLCPRFAEAVQAVIHVRAVGQSPFFKIVLITNASGLGLPEIHDGLRFFTSMDEIWAKLDAGTQAYMDKVNKAQLPLEDILANILAMLK